MEMFLTIAAMSVIGVVVSAVLFAAATRTERFEMPKDGPRTIVMPAAKFFAENPLSTPAPQIPIEALLLKIDHHVRLEQAAAEAFVGLPTRELLHSRTASPLMH